MFLRNEMEIEVSQLPYALAFAYRLGITDITGAAYDKGRNLEPSYEFRHTFGSIEIVGKTVLPPRQTTDSYENKRLLEQMYTSGGRFLTGTLLQPNVMITCPQDAVVPMRKACILGVNVAADFLRGLEPAPYDVAFIGTVTKTQHTIFIPNLRLMVQRQEDNIRIGTYDGVYTRAELPTYHVAIKFMYTNELDDLPASLRVEGVTWYDLSSLDIRSTDEPNATILRWIDKHLKNGYMKFYDEYHEEAFNLRGQFPSSLEEQDGEDLPFYENETSRAVRVNISRESADDGWGREGGVF